MQDIVKIVMYQSEKSNAIISLTVKQMEEMV